MSTVRELLEQSRAAHQQYRDAVPRRVASVRGTVAVPGDAAAARQALETAYNLRVEAHGLDPELADPAWHDEPITHQTDALLTFYAEQLGR